MSQPKTKTDMTGSAVSKDGTAIAFSKIGSGPALILVDGALCHRAFGPSGPLAQLLAPYFTVYSYDRRGRGQSGDTAPYAAEREIEDLEALIQEAGGSALLYGISSGAALALDATERLKNVRKVATYEAPFIVDDSAPPRPTDLTERLSSLAGAGRRDDAVKLFMKTVGAPSFAVQIMRLMPMWAGLRAVAHTLPYDFTVLGDTGSGRPLPKTRWANVKVPALVMDGGKSPAWMRNANRAIADLLPDSRYLTIEGQDHRLKPEAVVPALLEFFL
jgi:pimeloyl-ACP methyl ester carboxylesterase